MKVTAPTLPAVVSCDVKVDDAVVVVEAVVGDVCEISADAAKDGDEENTLSPRTISELAKV